MTMTLDAAPLNTPLTCVSADCPPQLCRRLAELGIRGGASVCIVGKTAGGGRVVRVAGSSIAVGRDVLRAITATTQRTAA